MDIWREKDILKGWFLSFALKKRELMFWTSGGREFWRFCRGLAALVDLCGLLFFQASHRNRRAPSPRRTWTSWSNLDLVGGFTNTSFLRTTRIDWRFCTHVHAKPVFIFLCRRVGTRCVFRVCPFERLLSCWLTWLTCWRWSRWRFKRVCAHEMCFCWCDAFCCLPGCSRLFLSLLNHKLCFLTTLD